MPSGLEGKVAVVTGAGSGIGRASAQALAAAGARVIATDLVTEAAQESAATLGVDAQGWGLDVADEAAVEATMARVADQWGGIDVLVNSAGISGGLGGPLELDSSDFDQVMRINLYGTFYACKYALPHLVERRGSIVNVVSVASLSGGGPPVIGPVVGYTASKHAVLGLTRSIAVRHGVDGVRSNAVLPGSVVSGMTGPIMEVSSQYVSKVEEATPLQRFGDAAEIASCVAFLAGESASFITGEAIVVDGGYMQTQGGVYTKFEAADA